MVTRANVEGLATPASPFANDADGLAGIGALERQGCRNLPCLVDRVAAVARIPGEGVVTVAEGRHVVANAAIDDIVALTAMDEVVAVAAV